jgi:hypothetical protein
LEEIGIPKLTSEQLEKLCEIGEKAARSYVYSKVSPRQVSALDIVIDTEGAKPVTVSVDVELALSPLTKDYDAEKLAKEATSKAFQAIKEFLSELSCNSTK